MLLLAIVLLSRPALRAEEGDYVGASVCAECHEKQSASWQGSDHDLAMREATKETVLGDFNRAQFTAHGVTSTFSQREGKYFVPTDGPDGKPQDYETAYPFGVRPLPQYLIAFPNGRYHPLNIAWDARPREAGGQRWFHLQPDEKITHDDVLHWTGIAQNWNTMCADCHSTNLRKGYQQNEDRYETRW
jgi:cytochrome c553